MKNILRRLIFAIPFFYCNTSISFSQSITTSVSNPTKCDKKNGTIIVKGLDVSAVYVVTYQVNSVSVNPMIISSESDGSLVIKDLGNGTYSKITLVKDSKTTVIKDDITLTDSCIGAQTTKFFGAAYANFTGIQDDDASDFLQGNIRLSQPLNKYQGISYKSCLPKRIIAFRNFLLQITYGKSDNLKMYCFDTLQDKYSNRLDLLSHAYFNGNITFNLLTFIVPKKWKVYTGNMAHIYLDFITSFIATNVTDTFKLNSPATVKSYNIKSNLYGLNLKGSFANAFDTRFSTELAMKIFWILPSSSTINADLNPQINNIKDIYLNQNLPKNFFIQNNKVPPFYEVDAQVQYNTGNVVTNSNSNVFLRYSYISNYVKNSSSYYHNNYFQFQIGYVLDVSKVFYPAASASTASSSTHASVPTIQ